MLHTPCMPQQTSLSMMSLITENNIEFGSYSPIDIHVPCRSHKLWQGTKFSRPPSTILLKIILQVSMLVRSIDLTNQITVFVTIIILKAKILKIRSFCVIKVHVIL